MSSKHLLIIKSFNNKDLVNAVTKNKFGEISVILSKKNISGQQFLELTELSIRNWQISPNESKKILECVAEMKKSPEKFSTSSTPSPLFSHGNSIKIASINSECSSIQNMLKLVIKPEKTPFSMQKPQCNFNTSLSDTPGLAKTSTTNDAKMEKTFENNNNYSGIEEAEQPYHKNHKNIPAPTITTKNKSPLLPEKPSKNEERKHNNQTGKGEIRSPTTKTRRFMTNKNNLAAQVDTNLPSTSIDRKPWMQKGNLIEQEPPFQKPAKKPDGHLKMQHTPPSQQKQPPPIPIRNTEIKKEYVSQKFDKLLEITPPQKSRPKLKIDTSVEIRGTSKDKIKSDRTTTPSSPNKLPIFVKHPVTRPNTSEICPKSFGSFRNTDHHQPSSIPTKVTTSIPKQGHKQSHKPGLKSLKEEMLPDYLSMDKCSNFCSNNRNSLTDEEGYLNPRSVTPQPNTASPSLARVHIPPNLRPPAAVPRDQEYPRVRLSVDNIYSLDPTSEYVDPIPVIPKDTAFKGRTLESIDVHNKVIPNTSPNLTKRPLPPTPNEYIDLDKIGLNEMEKRISDIIYNDYQNERFEPSRKHDIESRRNGRIVTNSLIDRCRELRNIPVKIGNPAFDVLKSEIPGSDEPDITPPLFPKKSCSVDEKVNENSDEATSILPSSLLHTTPTIGSYEIYHNPNLPLPPDVFPTIDTLNTNSDIDDVSDGDDSDDECGNISWQTLTSDPYYQYTDRKGAKLALQDKEDGSFLFRTSKKSFLGLTIKYKKKFFNLSLTRTPSNKLKILSGEESPEFSSIKEFVQHFTREPLTFIYENKRIAGIYLKEASN